MEQDQQVLLAILRENEYPGDALGLYNHNPNDDRTGNYYFTGSDIHADMFLQIMDIRYKYTRESILEEW
jgi:hypothetical protein